ncbi:MAG TPA: hypothetical protein EYH02_01015 [Ignisphaera aggregans]|uniref:Uncharacterized protein n=1 Tax=Ignisphaera aggregans TaxID=334771 RepID=A0A832YYU6_9CREN|nr:hypothetical protein [Ignisphaera aggregans]
MLPSEGFCYIPIALLTSLLLLCIKAFYVKPSNTIHIGSVAASITLALLSVYLALVVPLLIDYVTTLRILSMILYIWSLTIALYQGAKLREVLLPLTSLFIAIPIPKDLVYTALHTPYYRYILNLLLVLPLIPILIHITNGVPLRYRLRIFSFGLLLGLSIAILSSLVREHTAKPSLSNPLTCLAIYIPIYVAPSLTAWLSIHRYRHAVEEGHDLSDDVRGLSRIVPPLSIFIALLLTLSIGIVYALNSVREPFHSMLSPSSMYANECSVLTKPSYANALVKSFVMEVRNTLVCMFVEYARSSLQLVPWSTYLAYQGFAVLRTWYSIVNNITIGHVLYRDDLGEEYVLVYSLNVLYTESGEDYVRVSLVTKIGMDLSELRTMLINYSTTLAKPLYIRTESLNHVATALCIAIAITMAYIVLGLLYVFTSKKAVLERGIEG